MKSLTRSDPRRNLKPSRDSKRTSDPRAVRSHPHEQLRKAAWTAWPAGGHPVRGGTPLQPPSCRKSGESRPSRTKGQRELPRCAQEQNAQPFCSILAALGLASRSCSRRRRTSDPQAKPRIGREALAEASLATCLPPPRPDLSSTCYKYWANTGSC